MPLGIPLYCAFRSLKRSRLVALLLAPVCGCLLSFSVELLQVLFPGRHPAASDVLANTLGAALGGLLSGFLPTKFADEACWLWVKVHRSKAFVCMVVMVVLYSVVPDFSGVGQFKWSDFHNWNARFTFQIGNEATLNRPWLGKIYLTAVYNRALSPSEIIQHFQAGFSAQALTSRAQQGLIALYTFSEGVGGMTHDQSTYGRPLDLTFAPASRVRWLPDGPGIEIVRSAIIKSQGAAAKLFSALSGASAVSIEVWMNPANIDQTGPGRVVSYSRDPRQHNLMVGQQGADIDFRLRTVLSGKLRSPENLKTTDKFLTTDIFHIVATYEEGFAKLYVNGSEHSRTEAILGVAATRSPMAQIAYTFVYFFPVSFFLSIYSSAWSRGFRTHWLLPLVITMSLLGATEIFQAHVFGTSIDLPLIGYGVLTSSMGVWSGHALAREDQT